MIALNAKLLDLGCEVIINLLTDSVDLLQQNLSRFRNAGLSPSPKQFSELHSDPKKIEGKQWIIFSKKNAHDLEKLCESLRFVKRLVIIDDEADYASPNAKINSGEITKINKLIHALLEGRGKYIGVTATPARLDLNNTFSNDTELWVDFAPHQQYVGQDFFFPSNGVADYRLHTFDSTQGNERIELRTAIFHFLCGVAEQHHLKNELNFTMIVHTSGKTQEHREDFNIVEKTIGILADPADQNFLNYVKLLSDVAKQYDKVPEKQMVEFILRNINRNQIIEINSKKKNLNISDILDPKSLFSFGVGGNIISRGVTFDNLLSMYFTRGVKGKVAQDTYIQRARMFGSRGKYKNYFQLWITKTLLEDWVKCFVFHRLAIQSARSEMGAPVWLSDFRSTPTSASSIDRSSVDFEDGEMSFGIFDFTEDMELFGKPDASNIVRLEKIKEVLPHTCFPEYVYEYIRGEIRNKEEVCFHHPSIFGTSKSNYSSEEIGSIRRTKGIFATSEFARGDKPNAKHHLKVFFNSAGKARLFYKINGKSIKFMQNKK
ncbi:MAG: DNA helicase [Desulfobulbaceae bacterium]|nr:DNA helicase [Desulfobulbaceae bacterium]